MSEAPGAGTVLIVEDDEATADLEKRTLARAGLKVQIATRVRDALACLKTDTYCAILLDYNLPDGDPWAVVEAAKSKVPRIPVIVVTAMGNERVAVEAMHRGVAEYVKKSDTFWDQLPGVVDRASRLAQAEEKLRRTDAIFQLIATHASDLVITLDGNWSITSISNAARSILGYEPHEMVGMTPQELVHPEDLANTMSVLLATGTDSHVGVTSRVRRKDGDYVWLESNTYILRNPDTGIPAEIIGISRDITQRKREQEQIVRARDVAERANEAKSAFLSSMSHELRTPMNSILGFAQLLCYDDRLNLEQKTNVVRIVRAGEHLLQLINDVLDLSRIESGVLRVRCEPILLADVLDDCASLMTSLATTHGVKLHVDRNVAVTAYLNSDPIRLKQALINLISNAVKYNRTGGNVWVTCARNPNNILRITVGDDGPGISVEKQEKLFQPFNRLGQELGEIEGVGIGLVITQRVVELMGGTLTFESGIGTGTTFWVDFPEIAAGSTPEARVPGARLRPPPSESGNFAVLCIEDNAANIELIRAVFNTFWPNANLLIANSAEAGLELARTQRVDLILLDINLPRMDGFAALKHFRAMEQTMHTPVVALTADAMDIDVKRGRAAGFTDYLTKPIHIPTLCAAVKRLLMS